MKIFLLLFLILGFNVRAEVILSCNSVATCNCPTGTLGTPTDYFLKGFDIPSQTLLCSPIVQLINQGLEATAVTVDCDEDKKNLYKEYVSQFPRDCGYSWKNFNVAAFRRNIESVMTTGQVLCQGPYDAMCTSAVFLAFLMHAKKLNGQGLVTNEQLTEWSNLRGPVWNYINNQARPDLMLQELNLGTGRTLRRNQIPTDGWPKEGDIVQMWRNDNSGHSTIFSGFLKDSRGENIGLCYWSANLGTNGYGKVCEPIDSINRLTVGRFNE